MIIQQLLRAITHAIKVLLVVCGLGYACFGAASPKLLPFQGHLTDTHGNVIEDGLRLVQFKIYDAPVGGSAMWNGEVQKLTVNGGLVSTTLGSKSKLEQVDFNSDLYLEITFDANNDGQITQADPPLLPRQTILPAVFSKESALSRDSQKLAGRDWTPLFGVNSPDGFISANKLANSSVPATKLVPGSIGSEQIRDRSISGEKMAIETLPILTAWETFTATVVDLPYSTSGRFRRVGDTVEFRVEINLREDSHETILNRGGFTVELPFVIDFQKMPSTRRLDAGSWLARGSNGRQGYGGCYIGSPVGTNRVAVNVVRDALPPDLRLDAELSIHCSFPVRSWAAFR